jgi:hypothetical protein
VTPIKLSSQKFAEVLAALRQFPADQNSEKRRTTRMPVAARVEICAFDGKKLGPKRTVLARDISMEGIGLLAATDIKRGDIIVAYLPRADSRHYLMACQVVFVGTMADGLYTVGSRFTAEIPEGGQLLK